MMDGAADTIRFPHGDAPGLGDACEVAPGILWLRLPLPMKLDHVNVYALDEGDGWTVVDTGFHTAKTRALWEKVLAGPLQGRPVLRVVLTHHHPDHVGMAGWFAERGAEVWATRTAWLMARMLTLDVQEEISAQQVAFLRGGGMPAPLLEKRIADRPFNFADVVHPIPLGFRRLVDGQTVRLGGRDWTVHTGNGHAPEHATFWSADGTLVLAGDQVLPGISPNLGVYPTEPDADPVGEWLESCQRLKVLATDRHFVLPGHKLPFYGLPERLGQLIANHEGALTRLESHLAQARTANDCFPVLYKREIGEAEYGLALVEAIGHLNHLLQTGRATRTRRDDGAWAWQTADASLRA